jgi:Asp-tRNA(Asn)/Glu-tRNA(Gln) amidotransferase A subunit family amidase
MNSLDRRSFLAYFSAIGMTSTLFPGALWALAESKPKIERSMIDEAADIAGVEIKDEYKEMMLKDLNEQVQGYDEIRKLNIPNSVPPALVFDPVPAGMKIQMEKRPLRMSEDTVKAPQRIEDVAFHRVRQLAELMRTKRISSVALTEMYYERIKRYDPILHFAITLTTERALAQAREADREIAAGKYRGPLHGLPWGAKDLLSVKGYRTTWGAAGFEQQQFDTDATVVARLDRAGAVLLGKFTLGALAMGDVWFGGMTRNPWKTEQGSSGSSAGSASAVAAGCVAFAIGSETLGSISSPSTRVGTTGLRPTFGRVPRTGAMALSWSMDKIGPICRAVEDCALVLGAIYGPDGKDKTVRDLPFNWDAALDIRKLRIGYLRKDFEWQPKPEELKEEKPEDRARREELQQLTRASLDVLQGKLGLRLIDVELPDLPYGPMLVTLSAEAAAAFDELTRSGRDRLLTAQKESDWPNNFRVARFIPAVEYVQANRARSLAIEQAAKVFEKVDVIVAPTYPPATQLLMTNLTGHPAVILPNGFRPSDGTPVSLTFLGKLYDEGTLCAVAKAYQDATGFHLKYPDIKPAVEKKKGENKKEEQQ